jgi:hypothetical protein
VRRQRERREGRRVFSAPENKRGLDLGARSKKRAREKNALLLPPPPLSCAAREARRRSRSAAPLVRGRSGQDRRAVEERAHLRATTILCLEKYEGGAPAPAKGGLDGAIAARRYCKDVWSVILSIV